VVLTAATALSMGIALSVPAAAGAAQANSQWTGRTTTPIKHLVVIFQENVSFDHYFGTYPRRRTLPGSRSTPRRAPRRSTTS
jgi:phospholipase C